MTELKNMPGHLIRRFHQIAVAIFHEQVGAAGVDLTPVQFAALLRVRAHPDVDQATLAGLIAYDRTTIGGVVDRLAQKGYIIRQTSEKDRRARILRITSEGEAVLDLIAPLVETAQQTMMRGLTGDEAAELMRLLSKATDAVNELSRAPLKDPPSP
ncbi:MAG: MarR family transcriptional regulator [Neomegalonema sp.]|nr:MarR family transcriptional regulator [Neomegalonema sp.]